MRRLLLALASLFTGLGVLGTVNVARRARAQAAAVLPSPGVEGFVSCMIDVCRTAFFAALNHDFPKLPIFLLLAGVLGLMFSLKRLAVLVYSARFARPTDLKDIRLKNWLHHRKLPYALLIGHHVDLPEHGSKRKRVLSGQGFKPDKAILAISPGYGKRPELGHMALFGMSRSGKTLHLITQLCLWGGSSVLLDIKGELYRLTAGLRARKGKVYRLTPTGEGQRFDAISAILASHNGYATAAQIIAAPHLDKEPAFAQRAAAGIEAALRAAVIAKAPPLGFIRDLVYQGGVSTFVKTIARHTDEETRLALNVFLGMSAGGDYNLEHIMGDRYLISSWGSMTQRLRPFIQEGVQHLLSGNDFAPRDLMTTAATVYLDFPEESLEATAPVYNLLVTGLLRGMSKHVDEERGGQRPPIPVFFGLDEIARAPLQDLSNNLATAASRNISVLLYLQSPSQFDAIYTKDQTEAILNNCATQLYYKTESLATAEYIARRCHKVSVETESTSRKRGLFVRPTHTKATTAREVITVDEILALGGAERQLVIAIISGKPPTLVKRLNHYEIPELLGRLEPPAAVPVGDAEERPRGEAPLVDVGTPPPPEAPVLGSPVDQKKPPAPRSRHKRVIN